MVKCKFFILGFLKNTGNIQVTESQLTKSLPRSMFTVYLKIHVFMMRTHLMTELCNSTYQLVKLAQ